MFHHLPSKNLKYSEFQSILASKYFRRETADCYSAKVHCLVNLPKKSEPQTSCVRLRRRCDPDLNVNFMTLSENGISNILNLAIQQLTRMQHIKKKNRTNLPKLLNMLRSSLGRDIFHNLTSKSQSVI